MLRTYAIKDNHFDPTIDNQSILTLEEDVKMLVDASIIKDSSSNGYNIIKLLESASSETEIILSYEILYNISIGNTSFSEIIDYFDENSLPITFDSIENFFVNNSEDNGISYKTACVWYALYSKAMLVETKIDIEKMLGEINWEFSATDFSKFLEGLKKTYENIIKVIGDGISITKHVTSSSYYNFITISKYFTEDQDYLPEALAKYMIHPQYSPLGDNKTVFRNERYAMDAYISKLKQANPKAPDVGDCIMLNEMWKDMTSTGNPASLSNSRNIITDCLLYRPSVSSGVFLNNTYNDFLQWMLNTNLKATIKQDDTKEELHGVNVGMTETNIIVGNIVKKTIENIDKYNLEIDKQMKNCFSAMTEAFKNVVSGTVDVSLTTFFNEIAKFFHQDVDENVLAEKKKNLEGSKEALSYTKKLYNELFSSSKINYYSLESKDYLFYKTICQYIEKYTAEDFTLTSLRDWNTMQVIYITLSVYFKDIDGKDYIDEEKMTKFKNIVEQYFEWFSNYKDSTVELLNTLKQES